MNTSHDMIYIPVSLGELVDKITILEIKEEFITDPVKQLHIQNELTLLRSLVPKELEKDKRFTALHSSLKTINLSIWKSEDGVRAVSQRLTFDEKAYLEQTMNSHTMNEQRFKAKQEINSLGGSYIQEQKSYD